MSKPKSGTVYLVGAGPGDPGLLTLRGAELLRRAGVVIHDALVSPSILRLIPMGSEVIAADKRGADPIFTQDDINELMRVHAQAGHTVVRLKGGDPYIFGRGGEEAEALLKAGVPFEVVPGVSSFSAAAAYAGIPLTHRAWASAFTVISGHQAPEDPAVALDWQRIAQTHGTKVILMGLQNLSAITGALVAGGMPGSTPIALIRWGTTPAQETLVATLEDIAAKAVKAGTTSPVVAVIGEVVRLRPQLAWFERRPLFRKRVVVTRAREQAGELAARLAELGADVMEIPTIRIQPPTERTPLIEAMAGLGEYDWVVFTSANGVNAFFDGLLAAFEDIRSLGNLRLAAVGPGTAARLRELHLRVDATPAQFVGRDIAKAIREKESLDNLRILLARAEAANPELVGELEEMGAIVDDVAFYRTVPATEDAAGEADRLQTEGADWITFTSGSTVSSFHDRFDLPRLVRRHPRLRLASIGPETTKALQSMGLEAHVEARVHTAEGLVSSLLAKAAATAAV